MQLKLLLDLWVKSWECLGAKGVIVEGADWKDKERQKTNPWLHNSFFSAFKRNISSAVKETNCLMLIQAIISPTHKYPLAIKSGPFFPANFSPQPIVSCLGGFGLFLSLSLHHAFSLMNIILYYWALILCSFVNHIIYSIIIIQNVCILLPGQLKLIF